MNMLESISSYNFVEINGYAYFSNLFYNALFKVEVKTGKTTFLGNFAGERFSDTNIHFDIFQKEDQIYFFPRRGRHVHIYHLSEKTICAVEIQEKSKTFLGIEKVVFNDKFVYFFPKQKDNSIKRMEWDTCKVTNVSNKRSIREKNLSKHRKMIPVDIVQKYQIKYGEMASCMRMTNDRWYCFKPIGRHILYFKEGTNKLESITLTVVNEEELKKYLYKVKQNIFQSQKFFNEFKNFRLKEFLEVVVVSNGERGESYKDEKEGNVSKVYERL